MVTKVKKENLLIEIGTEEIPARFLPDASRQFKDLLLGLLKENQIPFDAVGVRSLYTPRRLAVFVPDVASCQNDRVELMKGPPASIALDEKGQWKEAALAFASKNGVEVTQLKRQKTEKGEYLFLEKRIKGRPASAILEEKLSALIRSLKFPKTMHWGDGQIYFARPVRWFLALLGRRVLRFKLESLASGRASFGYRWVKNPKVVLPKADLSLYLKALKAKGVYADFEGRAALIRKLMDKALGKSQKIHEEDLDLLTEVANLVEFPNVAVGTFDPQFLSIPAQVLSTAIKYHQKYLPIYDKKSDKLLAKFLVVYNGPRSIVRTVTLGNERVLRARLSDAAFFWEQDRKVKLADRIPHLKSVVFQEKLGTYFDKKERLERFCDLLENLSVLDSAASLRLKRAAALCKADLVTAMVGEFPGLQGIVGAEYALASGEDSQVAQAIREHYLPLSGSEGTLPKSLLGGYLAFVDKLDTVIAIFKVGLIPTGSQDPYGLRRLSSGLLRILYEKGISLSLEKFVKEGLAALESLKVQEFSVEGGSPARGGHGASGGKGSKEELSDELILKFFQERLENLFISLGFDHDLVRAVLARQSDNPCKAYKILKDLAKIERESFFVEASTVVERTFNILKGQAVSNGKVDEALLKEKEEIELYRVYQSNYDSLIHLIESGDFIRATSEYARAFSECTGIFFDKVLVNVEDQALRHNRYQLLKKIHELYAFRIADLSKIKGGTR